MKIIDIHIYLGKWHAPLEDINARQTLAVMDANSIEYGIAMGSEAIAYDFIEANAWVASQVETEGKGRLFAHVQVNGHYVEESLAELDKHLTKPSFLGVKIHPSYSQIAITHPNFEPILSRIQQIGKPVLLHTSSTAVTLCRNIVPIARRYPNLPIIMGHMGRNDWAGSIEAAAQADNLYLDPCCSFPERCKIEQAVKKVGAQRVVYGSAMMENHPAFTIGMITDADISQQERELIFWGNAKRLFDFPQ